MCCWRDRVLGPDANGTGRRRGGPAVGRAVAVESGYGCGPMPLRKLVFWLHLLAGLFVGIVVLVMLITGVLLTYELQIIQWAERTSCEPAESGRLPVAMLPERVQMAAGAEPSSLALQNDPTAPVAARFGRRMTVQVDPYTGRSLGEGSARVRGFFRWSWAGTAGSARRESGGPSGGTSPA